MKKLHYFFLVIILLAQGFAVYYLPEPEQVLINDSIEIKANYAVDKTISDNVSAVFLEVKNTSPYSLRFEPNFNSVLKDKKGWRYYRQVVKSKNEFAPGFVEPNTERKGFVYFKKVKNDQELRLNIKNIKVMDGKSSAREAEWIFRAVSENAENKIAEIELEASVADSAEVAPVGGNKLENLEYDKQLLVAKAQRDNYDQQKFKIELPQRVHRGDQLQIKVYAPTIVDVESVTMLIGVSQYVDLRKEGAGVFSAVYRIPELFDYGKYVVSFYIRFPDGNKTIRQKTLEIKSY